MQVTGYALRERLKHFQLRRDTAEQQFENSLFRFKEETKTSPDVIMRQFMTAEEAISQLQVWQDRYNLAVVVKVQGTDMPLAEAVNRLGGATRSEKMWREAVSTKRDRWERPELKRSTTEEHAVAAMTAATMLEFSTKAAAYTSALRSAIAEGNNTKIELSLPAGLLE